MFSKDIKAGGKEISASITRDQIFDLGFTNINIEEQFNSALSMSMVDDICEEFLKQINNNINELYLFTDKEFLSSKVDTVENTGGKKISFTCNYKLHTIVDIRKLKLEKLNKMI